MVQLNQEGEWFSFALRVSFNVDEYGLNLSGERKVLF
jgi:hypothetical protein